MLFPVPVSFFRFLRRENNRIEIPGSCLKASAVGYPSSKVPLLKAAFEVSLSLNSQESTFDSRNMSKFALVVLNFLPLLVFTTNGSQIGYIDKPEFSYLELHLLEVKYKISWNTTGAGRLFVCRSCNMTGPFYLKLQCARGKKCPDYREVHHCRSKGPYKICQIAIVSKGISFQAYVSRRDSRNVTKKSEVATYVTNETTKAPRPVTNLIIKPKNADLVLEWTPITIFSKSVKYSQWVICQAVQDKNAKAFKKMLSEFLQAALVIHSFNISATTKYQCCIKVENVINGVMSEQTCKNVTSPEQVPSAAPVIECGNSTNFVCPSKVKGVQRNVTIFFKAPIVKGNLTRHVVTYRNDGGSNSTTVKMNVSADATTAKLVGLATETRYLVSMESCNEAGCSPSSNTVEIPEIKQRISDGSPMTKVILIPVMMFVAVALVIMACFLMMSRNKKRAARIPLPALHVPTQGVYYNPINHAQYPMYNYLVDGNDVRTANYQVNYYRCTTDGEVNDGRSTTGDEGGQTSFMSNKLGKLNHNCGHT